MSGIAGIVHFDGAPVDREIVTEMAAAIVFRGPDAQQIWAQKDIAFCHTLLRTTFEAKHERQPLSLDGQVWITADARIDGRAELAERLGLHASALQRPDCELILHAYARWGEACVEHLLGDFAFAIWDGSQRRLFCARDHFGVKPFYYSQFGQTFLFSNAIDCLRAHPAVSDELNELAIADFLLFDFNQDPATTTFSDIRRLPPAHVLVANRDGVTIRRYWCLPRGESIRYKRTGDYVEHFRSLLETATVDRLRTDDVSVMMSGGLDSTSIAAVARNASPHTALKAHTLVYDWLIPDQERNHADAVARHLRIPIEFRSIDEIRPYGHVTNSADPEPQHDPLASAGAELYGRSSRVALTGDGADPLFCLSTLNSWEALHAIPLANCLSNLARYSWSMRAIPRVRLRSTLLGWVSKAAEPLAVPLWLNPDFTSRLDLRSRISDLTRANSGQQYRQLARRSLTSVCWPAQFEAEVASSRWNPIDFRRPYFDTRLVRFLLAVPELPFSVDKWLLRLAMKDLLPDQIRKRPKTPLGGDPFFAACKFHGFPAQNDSHPLLSHFVLSSALRDLGTNCSPSQLWPDSRAHSLNYWLLSKEIRCKKTTQKKLPRPLVFPTRNPSSRFMATSTN